MTDLSVSKIENLDAITLRKILTSPKLTNVEKVQFIKVNNTEIKKTLNLNITPNDFKTMMSSRPLIKFKPIKNSFTKRGDKILLAKTLGINTTLLEKYIQNVTEDIKSTNDISFLQNDKISAIKTYIFRHGSKDQLVTFLDYELKTSKNIIKSLYILFNEKCGAISLYFERPIHHFDNNTLVEMYNVVDKNIELAQQSGNLQPKDSLQIASQTLKRIYEIQNDNKLINALKVNKKWS